MRKPSRTRPSPSLPISIAALVVALTGTAFAGVATVSVLSKGEKKQVRKVVDTRIKKEASGLSVKYAAEAGNASNQEWAIVNGNGTLFRATPGITGASRDADGRYLVVANRSVANCYFVATLGGNTPDQGLRGDISVNPVNSADNTIYVLTSSEGAGVNSDRPFTLLVRC